MNQSVKKQKSDNKLNSPEETDSLERTIEKLKEALVHDSSK